MNSNLVIASLRVPSLVGWVSVSAGARGAPRLGAARISADRPYKGTTVRSFSPQELNEIYTVRAALESLAARLAAVLFTKADASKLRVILDEMIDAARRLDQKRMVQLDTEFHGTIVRISGNKMLHQLWQTLQFGHWTIVTTLVSNLNLEQLAIRHEELLEALMSRDPQKAMQTMQHHIEDLGKPSGAQNSDHPSEENH